MFCTECGAKLNSGAKFCGRCGTAISLEEQEENNDLNQKNQQNKSASSSTGLNEEGKYHPWLAARRGVKTKPPAPKGYDPGLATSRQTQKSISERINWKEQIPISRYIARHIDIGLVVVLFLIYLNQIPGSTPIRTLSDFYSLYLASFLLLQLIIEPLLICYFGTTPGKALYGIKVLNSNYSKLSFLTAFKRSLRVYWWGNLFGFGPLMMWANIAALNSYLREGITDWDKKYSLLYTSKINSSRRHFTHLFFVAFTFIIFVI